MRRPDSAATNEFIRSILATTIVFVLAGESRSDEGRLEINQTCATASGCFDGDTAGFPVTISTSGSYVVTGELAAAGDVDGIRITADNVTLDMNGFRLVSSSSMDSSADGVEGIGLQNVEIRNGIIEGFGGRGILLSDGFGGIPVAHGHRIIQMRTVGNGFQGVDLDGGGHLVSGSSSVGNGLWGFSVEGNSMIIDSVAENNVGPGLSLDSETGYRNTVVSNNNGGNANAQFIGTGVDLGGNLCGGNAICP
jgi:hypothetical protein